jgi:hypothetical protein
MGITKYKKDESPIGFIIIGLFVPLNSRARESTETEVKQSIMYL